MSLDWNDWLNLDTDEDQTENDIRFLALAMVGEAGEVANVVKKQWRGDVEYMDPEVFRAALADEMADTLVYLTKLAEVAGIDMDRSVWLVIKKLLDRGDRRFLRCDNCDDKGTQTVFSSDGQPRPGQCDCVETIGRAIKQALATEAPF